MTILKDSEWRHTKTDDVVRVVEMTSDDLIWVYVPRMDIDMVLTIEAFLRNYKEIKNG